MFFGMNCIANFPVASVRRQELQHGHHALVRRHGRLHPAATACRSMSCFRRIGWGHGQLRLGVQNTNRERASHGLSRAAWNSDRLRRLIGKSPDERTVPMPQPTPQMHKPKRPRAEARAPEMQACIDVCLSCYETCIGMAMSHCLERGGRHVEPAHFRLMVSCAEICRTSAHIMLTGSDAHTASCAACAEICTACAESCRTLDGMEDCVTACRACAESCRKMAGAGAMH
jgi:hypothetical protein